MKYQAILFDMDGTLLDTLTDMQAAVNYILEKYGYPTRTLEEVRRFVGNGAGPLIHRALPQGVDPDREAEILADYRAYYQAHNCVETRPYDGIGPLLERLRQEGRLELLAALLSGDQHTFETFRCEAPELVHLPQATYEWYCRNYLDRDYPFRMLLRCNGVTFPDRKEA